jgi:hypothetical protein
MAARTWFKTVNSKQAKAYCGEKIKADLSGGQAVVRVRALPVGGDGRVDSSIIEGAQSSSIGLVDDSRSSAVVDSDE